MVKVTNEIDVHQINGKSTDEDMNRAVGAGRPTLRIESHDRESVYVVLAFGEQRIAVYGSELQTAVANARNSGR